MRTPELLIASIKEKLDHFQIKLNNRKGDNDYYILAESLLLPVLEHIFDCKLENLNKTNPLESGIDLGDMKSGICFQITFQNHLNKIVDTIQKTIQKPSGHWNNLYVIVLSTKQSTYSQDAIDRITSNSNFVFSVSKNILDLTDISKKINFLASRPEALDSIEKHLTYILNGSDYLLKNSNRLESVANRSRLEEFIEGQYINNQYIRLQLNLTLLKQYSEIFSCIVSYEGELSEEDIAADNIFDKVAKYILSSHSENPLVVTGIPGSGKSTFLSLLYKFLKSKIDSEGDLNSPVYINLQYYLKFATKDEALSKLKHHLAYINDNLNKKKEVILILDGCDDSFRYVIETADTLINTIQNELGVQKKNIGVNISDSNFQIAKPQNKQYNFADSAEAKINLQNLSIYDKNYERFIELYVEIKTYESEIPNEKSKCLDYLKARIKKFKITRIDFFTLFIFCEKRTVYAYNKCETLSDFYKQFCLDKIRGQSENSLISISDMAFNFYIKKIKPDVTSSPGWELIHTHLAIRDYLLAFQVIHQLKKIGTPPYSYTKKDYQSFNFVYTDLINNFCKEIMNSDKFSQKSVYDAIVKIFDKLEQTAQTHFCYLLGRLSGQTHKEGAHNFLTLKLEQAEKTEPPSPDNQFLLYCRTIYISLIYLGDKKANNRYLDKLSTDAKWDTINRGFHREYYGDIPYDPGLQSLTLEDNITEDFPNTYSKLIRKLNDSLSQPENYNLFEIELYTLCSLAQHRQANTHGNIEAEQLAGIGELIGKIIESKRLKDSKSPLLRYIELLFIVFSRGKFLHKGVFLEQVYSIKEEDRAGWKERILPVNEKVSSHIYGAYVIGKLCLPEKLPENPKYKKSDILEMILIHDLGESMVGDRTPQNKTPIHRKNEQKAIDFISMLGKYFDSELSGIAKTWRLFESKEKEDINVQIANDLDKLDNLMQLYLYTARQGIQIDDFKMWKDSLIENINSDEGKKIRDLIVTFYESEGTYKLNDLFKSLRMG